MPKHIILKFPLPPASLDPPRGVHKMGRTNMVSKHQIYRVEMTSVLYLQNELRCMDLCTFFSILDMHRALANC